MSDKETIRVYGAKRDDYINLAVGEDQVIALDMFCDGLAEGAQVFDLGCGPGHHARLMMERGLVVYALDATPEFVEVARESGVDARLGTFDDLTEVAAYDGVWASFSLLHAPKADFPRHLAACHRALRPGGRLFLGMKTGTGERRDALGRFYAYYTEEELKQVLEETGFTLLQSHSGKDKGLAGSVDPYVLMVARA